MSKDTTYLTDLALAEYYNTRACNENAYEGIAVRFADGTVMSAGTLSIYSADGCASIHQSASMALYTAVEARYGLLPPPIRERVDVTQGENDLPHIVTRSFS